MGCEYRDICYNSKYIQAKLGTSGVGKTNLNVKTGIESLTGKSASFSFHSVTKWAVQPYLCKILSTKCRPSEISH